MGQIFANHELSPKISTLMWSLSRYCRMKLYSNRLCDQADIGGYSAKKISFSWWEKKLCKSFPLIFSFRSWKLSRCTLFGNKLLNIWTFCGKNSNFFTFLCQNFPPLILQHPPPKSLIFSKIFTCTGRWNEDVLYYWTYWMIDFLMINVAYGICVVRLIAVIQNFTTKYLNTKSSTFHSWPYKSK